MKRFLLSLALMVALCVPWAHGQTTPPFDDNFEGATSNWTFVNGSLTNQWCIGTATNHGGSKAMYISNDGGTSNAYSTGSSLVVYAYKEFTLSAGQYEISYDWKCYGESNYDYLRVVLVPSTTTLTAGTSLPSGLSYYAVPSTWTALDGGTKLNLVSSWQSYSGDFTVSTAGTYKIAFVWRNDNSGGTQPPIAVDNFHIAALTCPKPTALTASNLTEATADISWTAGASETSWEYVYGVTGFTPDWTNATTVATPNATLAGLTANTKYDFYVRAVCTATEKSMAVSFSLRTACSIETITKQHTIANDFEDETTAISGSSYYFNVPNCWSKINDATNANYQKYPCIYYSSYSSYFHSGNRSIYFYQGSSTSYQTPNQILILPQVTNDVSTLRLKFWARTSSTANGKLYVGVMEDPEVASSFTSVDTITFAATSTYYEFEVALDSYEGSGKYVAIKMPALGSATIYLDDVELSLIPTCVRPTDVTVSNITNNQATFSWTPGKNETAWILQYKASGDANWSSANVSTNPYTLNSLAANETYTYRVQSDCSTEQSEWTNEATFKTLCNPVDQATLGTISFETSEGYTSGQGSLANSCWTVGNLKSTTNTSYIPYVYNSSTYARTGSNSLRMYAYKYSTTSNYDSAYAVMPPMTFTGNFTAYEVHFYMRKGGTSTSYNDTLWVGVVSDPSDMSTLQILGYGLSTEALYGDMQIVKFTNYTGGASGHIVFLAAVNQNATSTYKYASFYVDDIQVIKGRATATPTDVAVSNITTSTVDVSFTSAAASNRIMLATEVVADPETYENWALDTVMGTSPVTIPVQAGTMYRLYVQGIGTIDSSFISNSVKFRSACAQYDVRNKLFTCGFETSEGYNYASSWTEGVLEEHCWETLGMVPSGATYPYYRITNEASYSHNSSQALKGFSAQNSYAYWILPEFNAPTDSLSMEFWYRNENTNTSSPYVEIGYMTDPTDDGTFTQLQQLTKVTTMTKAVQNFGGLSVPTNARIAIRFGSATSQKYYCSIDDIIVRQARACSDPDVPTVSKISPTSAVVNFTDTCTTHDAWQYVYGETGFDYLTATPVSVDTTSFALTGLDSETDYTVYVRTNCGSEYSYWVPAQFRTLCAPVTLPDTIDFEDFTTTGTGSLKNTCWTVGNLKSTSIAYTPYVYDYYAHSGNNCMRVYAYTNNYDSAYAVLPPMNFAEGITDYQVKFWMKKTSTSSYSSYNDTLYVGIVSDPGDMSTLQIVGRAVNTTTTYNKYNVKFTNYTGATPGYIVFLGAIDQNSTLSSKYASFYVDDIVVEQQPDCEEPLTVTTTNKTKTSITANWAFTDSVPANCTGYEAKIALASKPDSVLRTVTLNNRDTASCKFTYLDRLTEHIVSVRALCGEGNYSIWESATVTTLGPDVRNCPAVTLNVPDSTITAVGATAYWTPSDADYFGSYDLLVSDTAVTVFDSVAPQYTGLTDTTLYLALDEYTNYYVYVRVNCNGYGHNDSLAWSNVAHFKTLSKCAVPTNLVVENRSKHSAMLRWTNTAQGDNYRYYITTDSAFVPAKTTTPTVQGIYADSVLIENLAPATTYYLYLSNNCGKSDGCSPWIPATFTTVDSCLAPSNLQATEIQKYQATITWEPNPCADSTDTYDMVVSEEQVDPDTCQQITYPAIAGTSKVASLLKRNTHYYIYVRANCGTLGNADWVSSDFTTLNLEPDCENLVEKEITVSGTSISSHDVPTWAYYNHSISEQIYTASEINHVAGSINSISFYCNSNNQTRNVQIYLANTSKSTFTGSYDWIDMSSSDLVYSGTFQFSAGNWCSVGFDTPFEYDGTSNIVVVFVDNTSWVSSYPYCNAHDAGATRSIYNAQDNYTPDPTDITLSGTTNTTRNDIRFGFCGAAEACPTVTNVVVPEATTLNNQATITWNPGKGDFTSSYDVKVSTTQITDFTGVTPTATNIVDTFYTATGLTAETPYYVYVRANCQQQPYNDGSSVWSAETQFTTEASCVKPWDFQVTGTTSNTVSLQWVNRNNAQNWKLDTYNFTTSASNSQQIAVTGDTCRYTLNTGLTPNTLYNIGLSAVCGASNLSETVYLPSTVRTQNNETNIRIDSTLIEAIGITSDSTAHTIAATVRKGSDLTDVYFYYTTSPYVSYVISGNDTLYNPDHLDFTNPVTLTVVAEDTAIRQNWTVTLTEEACATVYNVAAENVSRRTADLVWNVGDNSTSFNLVVSKTELTNPATGTVQSITATNVDGLCTYALSGLDRETEYYVYVRTNCGAIIGQWRGTSFTTMGTNPCEEMTIGSTSASSNNVPTNVYYNYSYSQQIFTADELGKAGNITSLSFFNSSSSCTRNFDVYLMHTTKSSFADGNDYVVPSASDMVYSGNVTCEGYGDTTEITLTTPFEYNGTDNVVLIIDDNTGSYEWSSKYFYGEYMSDYMTLNTCGDGSDFSPASPGTMSTYSFRMKTIFNVCNDIDICPDITNLHSESVTTSGATIAWTQTAADYPGTSEFYYSTTQVVDTTGLSALAQFKNLTDTFQALTGLDTYTTYYVYVRTHCTNGTVDDGWTDWVEYTFKTESACEYPRNVIATLTGKTSVNVTWTDAQGQTPATAYQYAYNTTGINPASGATSTTGSADLTGLTANTTYYIYVRKDCGAGAYSPWVNATITIPAAMPAPIIEETYDISYNAFQVRWTRDYANYANETEWQYACVAQGGTPSAWTTATDTTAIVYGLTDNTTYDIYVRAGNNNNHSNSDMATVTTTALPDDCLTIGTGTGSGNLPVSNYNYCYTQIIYPASEVGKSGTIERIQLQRSSYANVMNNMKVYIGTTTKSAFSSTTDWVPAEDLTEVYNGSFAAGTEWLDLQFTTPYAYNGTSNIVIAISNGHGNWYSIQNFKYTDVSNSVLYRRSDNYSSYADHPGTDAGLSTSYRTNIQFCFAAAGCAQPNHLTVDQITTTSARATWYPGNTETSWNYYVATEEMTDNELNAETTTSTTSLVHALAGLNKDTEYHLYVRANCGAGESSSWAHAMFNTLPTCSAPVNAVAVSNADNEITFDAAAGTYGTVGSYDYWYWKDGTTDTVKVNGQTATYVASNVAVGNYHWQVRANCGTTDGMSRWTPGNDVRVCGAYDLPYTQGFEEIPTTYSGPGMIETICWNDLNAGENSNTYPYYNATTSYITEGSRSLQFHSNYAIDLYTIMPPLNNATDCRVSFDCMYESTSSSGTFKLGYMTDITDESTFVPVYTDANRSASAMISHAVTLHGIPANARLAFFYGDAPSNNYYGYLDNIVVDTIPIYTLSNSVLPSAEQGSIEVICQATDTTADGRFYGGTTPMLKANAATGFEFTHWSNGSTVNPLTVTMESDTNLVANFDSLSYRLNVVISSEAGQSEMGDVTGSGNYKTGTPVTVEATNIDTHRHVEWSDGSKENPHTFPMPGQNTTLVARFVIDSFSVATAVNVDSMGTVSGAGRYQYDSTATITATPSRHHHFVRWQEDGMTTATRTYNSDTTSATFTAEFRIDTMYISAKSNDAGRGSARGSGWYNYNDSATLTAYASTYNHYHFANWSNGETTPSITVPVDSAHPYVYTANFEIDKHTVKAGTNSDSLGTVTPDSVIANYGSYVTFTATELPHGTFERWSNGATTPTITVKVTGNTTLTAIFTTTKHEIIANVNDPAMGHVEGPDSAYWSTTDTLVAVPAAHHHFVKWNNGETNDTLIFRIMGDTSFTANFRIDTVLVDAIAVNGSVAGTGYYDYGSTVTLTATADNHYHFVNWSNGKTTPTITVNALGDSTLTANFEADPHTVAANVNVDSMGSVIGAGTYGWGSIDTLVAVPAAHHHFVNWSNGETNETLIFRLDGDTTFTANFRIDTMYIAAQTADETMGTTTGSGWYNYNSTADLTGVPNDHYHFLKWDNDETTPTITVPVDSANPYTYTASFEIDKHDVAKAVNVDSMGTVVGNDGSFDYGTDITMIAKPAAHHHFWHWSNGETNDTINFTLTQDTLITAFFRIDTVHISAVANIADRGTVTGASGWYNYGTEVTVQALPTYPYTFKRWNNSDTLNPYTLTLTQDTDLTAIFSYNDFTVTVRTNDATKCPVTGAGTFLYGYNDTIQAYPAEHYHFVSWSNGILNNPYYYVVTNDTDVYVNYALDQHVVTTIANNIALGSVTGAGSYDYGTQVTVEAVPADHAIFTNWSDGNTNNPRTFTITEDVTFTANFIGDVHVITANVNDAAMGTTTGSGNYNHGVTATLVATPAPHHHFVDWSNGVTNNSFPILVENDSTVTANFAIDQHVVNANVNDNTLGTVTGTGSYNYGAQVTITAVPNDHVMFNGWSDGEMANPRTFTLTADTLFTANFAGDMHTISALVNDAAMGSTSGSGTYHHGDVVTLTATPAANHHFTGWSNGVTMPAITMVVANDLTVTANFAIDQHVVAVDINNSALGTVTGTGTYDYGTQVTLTAVPAHDHIDFLGWSDGSTDITRSFVLTDDVTLTANFAVDTHVISANVNNARLGSTTGSGTYNHGDFATLTATAFDHCHFVDWSNGSTTNPLSIYVDVDSSVTANFAIDQHNVTSNADGSVLGTGAYSYGDYATLTAVAPAHKLFLAWSNGATANPYSFQVTSDVTITAIYTDDAHVITANVNNATMGRAMGSGTYTHGQTVTLTAIPSAHHHFVNWSNGVLTESMTLTADSDYVLVANFAIDQHVITTNLDGSVTGAGTYNYGDYVTLTATAPAHKVFSSWSNTQTANPYTFQVTADADITAIYVDDTHVISATANDAARGSITGTGSYTHGTMATLTAVPNLHYHFVDWSNGVNVSTFSILVLNDSAVTANFAIDQHTVTTTVNNTGAGSVTGAGSYDYNSQVTLTAVPNDHFVFSNWSDGSTANPYTFTLTGDIVVTANFAADNHTITANVNDASMGSVTGAGSYTHGAMATLVATAADHYHFVNWSNGSANSILSFIVENDSTVTANFAIDQHTVTTVVNNNTLGSVSGAGTYNYGATATLTATANAHAVFTGWSNGMTTPTINVTVTGNMTITANFVLDSHVISANVNDATMGTVTGAGTYTHGDMATLTATAMPHYHFVNWSNGETNNVLSFIVDQDVNLTANFAVDQYIIVLRSNDATMGTVSGSGAYDYGTNVSIVATPADHYHFVNWSNGSTAATTTVTITKDTVITANFEIDSYNVTGVANDNRFGRVTGSGSYTWGEVAELTAVAADHYHFVNWSNGSTSKTIYVNVASDTTLTANFEIDTHLVTVKIDGNGQVSGDGAYDYNETATLTAVPDAGYEFKGWFVDGTLYSSDDIITFTVTDDITFQAVFTELPTSVDETEAENFIAYTEGMNIVVTGAENKMIAVFDMAGKLVKIVKTAQDIEYIDVNAAGVYLIRIDNRATLRAVVK